MQLYSQVGKNDNSDTVFFFLSEFSQFSNVLQGVLVRQRICVHGRSRGRSALLMSRSRLCCKRSMLRINPLASAASPLSWLPKCFLAVRSLLALKIMISESVHSIIQLAERSASVFF